MTKSFLELAAVLQNARRVLLTAHRDPDGDAVGSTLGLQHLLISQGKQAAIRFSGAAPELYSFLPGFAPDLGQGPWPDPEGYDLAVLLDCHEFSRAGAQAMEFLPLFRQVAVLDHHEGTTDFGQFHWVAPEYSSTCEMVAALALHLGWELNQASATCFYTGILTDTGSFHHVNTRPGCLQMASLLVEKGADPSFIAQEVYSITEARLRLMVRVLGTVEISAGGRLAAAFARHEDLVEFGCGYADLDLLVEQMRSIRGVDLAILMSERTEGMIKISMRSRTPVEVADLAISMGGGGHRHAAGLSLPGTLEEAKSVMLAKVMPMLAETMV